MIDCPEPSWGFARRFRTRAARRGADGVHRFHTSSWAVALAALVPTLVSGCATNDGSSERAAADAFAVRATKQVCTSLGACCGAASFAFDPVECEAQVG